MPVSKFIRGGTSPIFSPVATATAIALGDLTAQVSGNAVAAGSFTWTTDLATTQTNFAAAFLGVAASRKDANVARVHGYSTDNTLRTVQGIWEFDCASASFAVGDLVGPAKQTGNLLEPQKVVSVATVALSIGRVVEATSSATRVRVEIHSTLHPTAR